MAPPLGPRGGISKPFLPALTCQADSAWSKRSERSGAMEMAKVTVGILICTQSNPVARVDLGWIQTTYGTN